MTKVVEDLVQPFKIIGHAVWFGDLQLCETKWGIGTCGDNLKQFPKVRTKYRSYGHRV